MCSAAILLWSQIEVAGGHSGKEIRREADGATVPVCISQEVRCCITYDQLYNNFAVGMLYIEL